MSVWWKVGFGVLVLALLGYIFFSPPGSKPSAAQVAYLNQQLAETERIEISAHAKLGGEVLATISDPNLVFDLCEAVVPVKVHAPTGSFGPLELTLLSRRRECISC